MKLDGISFKNSKTCEGTSFTAPNAPLDIAVITIMGRYPEKGWALNEIVHEIVRVEVGSGTLEFKGGETIILDEGDVVSIKPQEWFAWNGNMKLIMACQPAFNQNQYRIKE